MALYLIDGDGQNLRKLLAPETTAAAGQPVGDE